MMIVTRWIKPLVLLPFLLSLAACGTLQVVVEATPTSPPQTPMVIPATREASPAPTSPAPSEPAPTPSPPAGGLQPGQAVKIVRTHMLNETSGWGTGQVETDLDDHILFTTDGGQTWQDRTPQASLSDGPANGLAATAFFGSQEQAWVAYSTRAPQPVQGKPLVWHTRDGGQTWNAGEPLDLSGLPLEFYIASDLGFFDGQHGWIMAHLGAGMMHDYISVFTSADGGQTWRRILDPNLNPELMGCTKSGLTFTSQNTGWLAGNCPGLIPSLFLYRTTDGGKTWDQISPPAPAGQPADLFAQNDTGCGIPGLVYASSRSILLVVRCTSYQSNSSFSWLYASEDGGINWSARNLPVPFEAFEFASPERGWMVGSSLNEPSASGELYFTTDGGRIWTPVIPTGWQGTPDFVSADTGWVVARSSDRTALVFTHDGGKNWKELKPVIGK